MNYLKSNEGKDFILTKLQRKEYLKNTQDPATGDKELFRFDKDGIDDEKTGPFTSGAFPTPKYDPISYSPNVEIHLKKCFEKN